SMWLQMVRIGLLLCWLSVIVNDLTGATHCGPIGCEPPGLALRQASLRVELIATVIEETYYECFTKALDQDDVPDRLGHHRLRSGGGRCDQDMPLSSARLHLTSAFSASASKFDRHNRCIPDKRHGPPRPSG